MNQQDDQKFKETMVGLGEVYDKTLTQTLLKLYWATLKQYSIEEVVNAISNHVSNPDNGQFFPKPADIIKQITGTTKQIEQSIQDRAELAWSIVEAEISRTGAYRALKLEDKLALATVKAIGGWSKLCQTNTDKLPFVRKEFISTYKNLETTPIEALPNKLPGLTELNQHKQAESKHIAKSLNPVKFKLSKR